MLTNRQYIGRPQCRVLFFTQANQSLGPAATLNLGVDDHDDLIAVQTQKDLRQPAGHFSITLVPRPLLSGAPWRNVLRPGDLVQIEMGPDKAQPASHYQQLVDAAGYGGLETVMVGSIDNVRETTSFGQDGRPERAITITGRDFGKYLVDDQVWWDGFSNPARAIYGFAPEIDLWLRSKFQDGRAAGLVQFFLKWMEQHFDIAFRFPDGKDRHLFRDMLRYSLTTASPSVAAPMGLLSYQGAPWSLMERVASPPFFTLQIDTRRALDVNLLLDGTGTHRADNQQKKHFGSFGTFASQPALLLYRTPHSNREYDDWLNLPTRVVKDVDLIAMDIGRGSEELSNTWRVWTDAVAPFRAQAVSTAEARQLRDLDSVQRYGERPLVIQSAFVSGLGSSDQVELVRRYSFLLKDWNRWNEWLLNGRMTMKGMAAVKCGDRLWHWDHDFGSETEDGFTDGVDYYVEGVTQNFRAFTGWTTEVALTRGQRHRERGKVLRYTDVQMTDADLQNPDAANRKALRALSEQVSVWGEAL